MILFVEAIIIVVILAGLVILFLPKTTVVAPVVREVSGIQVLSPKPDELISSPLKITGSVNGMGWTGFEGQVGTVRLLDSEGKQLALGILTATTEWMQLPTNFETSIYFDYPGDGAGQLVFYNENASGEPERDKTFTIPVKLQKSSSEKTTVKVYFNNSSDIDSCDKVFSMERVMPKTPSPAMAALTQLLLGPTNMEKNAGLFTSINTGVVIQKLTIENGVAKVDFNEELQKGVAGSCKVIAIRAQITQTLMQFSTVKSVVISINGNTEEILQP